MTFFARAFKIKPVFTIFKNTFIHLFKRIAQLVICIRKDQLKRIQHKNCTNSLEGYSRKVKDKDIKLKRKIVFKNGII